MAMQQTYQQQPMDNNQAAAMQEQYYQQQQQQQLQYQQQQQPQQLQQQQQQQQQQQEATLPWSWKAYPQTRLEAARMVVPLGCLYPPLAPLQVQIPPQQTDPVHCKSCQGILNPFCQVDFHSKIWVCPFCSQKNSLPHQYINITESNMPPELHRQCATIEYACRVPAAPPPFFLFVIDLCVGHADPTDLEALRDTLLKACNWLPPKAQVGVITYGTCVHVHELESAQGGSGAAKVFTFKGCKEYDTAQVIKLLRLPVQPPAPRKDAGKGQPRDVRAVPSKFFASFERAEEVLTQLFDELAVDPWPVARGFRQRRCTGAAISVATALADALYPGIGGRIMLFLSGPCTEGPGKTVDLDLGSMIRGHTDLKHDLPPAKYWSKSKEFYDRLSKRVVDNGHCVDAFLNALDQVGFAEMRSCVSLTGGTCLLADSFKNPKFMGSFQKFFRQNQDHSLAMAFNAKIEVQTSQQWKVAGGTGPMIPTGKRSPSVHTDCELGMGGTCEWAMPALDDRTHLAFFFEVANIPADKVGDFRFVQFVTTYTDSNGQTRKRVCTVTHRIVRDGDKPAELARHFDQAAAAVLMARLSAHKAEEEHLFDVLRWLDRHLIKVVSKFSTYEKDKASSLVLAEDMRLFPGFMFHLRRSPFLHVFNSSPDETVFFRLWLDRESVEEAIVMLQPALFAFTSAAPTQPVAVLLDSSSVQNDNILVLDTYFEVVVHYGATIAAWRNAGYQHQPNFGHFQDLLSAPRELAQKLVTRRYPEPRFVECDHHGSQARLLYNVINPSVTHKDEGQDGQAYGDKQGEIVYTDDAPMSTFLEHLKRLAVQN